MGGGGKNRRLKNIFLNLIKKRSKRTAGGKKKPHGHRLVKKSLKKYLVQWKNENTWLLLLWHIQMRRRFDRLFKKYSDEEFVRKSYYKNSGRELNLDNPQLLSEKISWLMLNYRDPLMTQCADKYSVREYVKSKGYESILNELYGVYDRVEDIDISKLPDKFILKATHSSHRNIICTDKNKIFWFPKKLLMKSWLKENTYHIGREWVYNNIKPRIVSEKYLENSANNLIDYKFYCMNGKPQFIDVLSDRNNHKLIDVIYDLNWKKIYTPLSSTVDIDTPLNLSDMIKAAQVLSEPFPHVRVDFYEVHGRLYFGELTFYSAAGHFDPVLGDKEFQFGQMLELPK